MTKQITVGIHPDSSYSAQVLSQLGITGQFTESFVDGIEQGVRVFLWNEPDVMSKELPSAERVAIITHHACLRSLVSRGVESVSRSHYFGLEHSPFSPCSFYVNLPAFQIEGRTFGVCYDRNNDHVPNSGIRIVEEPNLLIVSVPWNICGYQQGAEWEPRPYFSRITGKHFVEIGPLLDTGAFRHLLLEILLYCFNWTGIPLVRVSPFYRDKRYFSFRVDADGFTESSTEGALRMVEKSGLRFTWFIDTASWKNEKNYILKLKECNQDIQLHCFRHMTYVSEEVNDINIRKGLVILQENGVAPNAIASPFGYNDAGFSEAIRKHGFVYSSEFGYAVDDLPSYPWNDRGYPLQIPVHPGCSGTFLQAGFSEQECFDHLLEHVLRMCSVDGICILYDHPINGMETHEFQYTTLFELLREMRCEYICMSDYCRAWLERPHNPTIVYDRGRIHVDGFRENGFRLEQLTNGSIGSVQWEGGTLPQVSIPPLDGEFRYPSAWIQELACKKGLQHLRKRNSSKFTWRLYEGYYALRRARGFLT